MTMKRRAAENHNLSLALSGWFSLRNFGMPVAIGEVTFVSSKPEEL